MKEYPGNITAALAVGAGSKGDRSTYQTSLKKRNDLNEGLADSVIHVLNEL